MRRFIEAVIDHYNKNIHYFPKSKEVEKPEKRRIKGKLEKFVGDMIRQDILQAELDKARER